jgi:cytosine/adenosine deaminase-related metal-dependent hydrolase
MRRPGARLLRLGGLDGPARHPQPCRRHRRPPARRRGDARGPAPRRALPRPPARRLPAGRPLPRPGARANLLRALDMGVDVVGGIPHFERTMEEGAASVRDLARIAAERGLMSTSTATRPTTRSAATSRRSPPRTLPRLGLPRGRLAPHLDAFDGQLLRLEADPADRRGGLCAIPNPLINIVLQGRHDTYPKRRGLTRVKEMQAAGIPSAGARTACATPGTASAPATCSTSPSWAFTSPR